MFLPLLLSCVLCAVSADESDAWPQQQVIFEHSGQDWYRIPSIAVTGSGSVLVFTGRRKGSAADFGHDTDLVMTVRASRDGGQTWPHRRRLNDQFAAYSDLAASPDGMVHCVYESGSQAYHDQLTYARFPLAWLTAEREPP